MKNIISKITLSTLAVFAAGSAFAESYVFPTANKDITFTQVSDYIKTTYNKPDFAFDNTVDLTINSTYADTAESYWTGLGGLTLKSLTINGMSRIRLVGTDGKTTKIGTLTIDQSTQKWGGRIYGGNWEFDNVIAINDGTDPAAGISLGEAGGGRMQSLKVSGDVIGKISQFRVSSDNKSNIYDAARWNTADIDIKGKISSSTSHAYYFMTSAESGQFYYKVGALNQNSTMNFQSRTDDVNATAYVNYMITGNVNTNGGSAVMGGDVTTAIQQTGKNKPILSLFMNSSDGNFTQSFTGNSLQINGGITVMSGTLLVNFKEWSGLNHGDLTMTGGKFGSSNATTGAFQFKDLVYSGGTVALALNGVGNFDSLKLSGTIKNAEGSMAKLVFDFGKNLTWLIDSEENGGLGVKIISWSAQSGLDETSFIANGFSNSGDDYVADFTSTADGLYVKYVAVPEASTFAAIFGAFALAFAAYKRRK